MHTEFWTENPPTWETATDRKISIYWVQRNKFKICKQNLMGQDRSQHQVFVLLYAVNQEFRTVTNLN
jgi:hypothetical protein